MNINDLITASNDFITYVKSSKEAIRQAIIAKGVTVSYTDTLDLYASSISEITGGGTGTIYTVQYIDWDGTLLKSQNVLPGGDVNPPLTEPQRTGYNFSGWDISGLNVQSDLTITAQYIYAPNLVSVLDYDLSLIDLLNVETGANLDPVEQTHNKLMSDGWFGTLENVQGSGTVIAKYKTNPAALYLFLTLTEETGLTMDFNIWTTEQPFVISFGDGSTAQTNLTAPVTLSHTYASYGDYIVAFWGYGSVGWDGGIAEYQKSVLIGNQAKAITKCFEGITSTSQIGGFGLKNCINLTSVYLDDTKTELSKYTLYGCSSLKNLVVPASVASVGNYALTNCSTLEKIVFLSETPPTFGSYIFNGVPLTCEIYVPDSAITAYQAAMSIYSQPIYGLSQLPSKYT